MAKGPGVSATSRIIATSQTNIQYYSEVYRRMQEIILGGTMANKWRIIGNFGMLIVLRPLLESYCFVLHPWLQYDSKGGT